MFTQNFEADFSVMLSLMQEQRPFVFSRFNDGEARVLRNEDVGNKDGWYYKKDRDLFFRAALRQSLLIKDPAFFYGLSGRGSDAPTHDFLIRQMKADLAQITFGNIFSLNNSRRFAEEMLPVIKVWRGKKTLVASPKINPSATRASLGDFNHLPIQGCCVKLWQSGHHHLLGQLDLVISEAATSLFLFSAGPLTKILIHECWKLAPHHLYLDIGSAMDLTYFAKSWRAEHRQPEKYSSLIPSWK